MEIIGHRGCAAQCPENTLLAIREAARRLPAVEVDVRRCGSGELVVVHDETLERVADVDRRVAETSWSELQELTVLDSAESIPRLESVLRAVPDDVTVQLELKEREIAADTLQLAMAAGADVRVSSFLPDAIAEIDAACLDVPNGLLFGEEPETNLSRALEYDCTHVFPHYDLCVETDVVPNAREHDLNVIAWKAARTVDDVRTLHELGVDGVTADRWDIVPPALKPTMTTQG
ncbi:glycerophosphodiester phosphodiesterase [Natronorubrum sulfidifaciens]|uniref:Glycerophosphoryl diester phosphodiesterase n=1 Tax=Natronorubrum sulfidifaciens JCM 14089 TaxID=1230460 RepID=L9WBK3_9EURY|nr:glycerophosphodiester phosphodiesterase [Natronorubrum sulfidifaciens]ELY45688.1 glycerophosphoryl diester phosphodiesterase [Natronorubrum sulfidifaciens JCM 14089]